MLDVTAKPRTCFQTPDTHFGEDFAGSKMWNPNTPLSEDCLYLTVVSPEGARNAAVMVWIHGGGFVSGTSTLDIYDYASLAAEQGVVVAAMQYRVGPLGFLYLNGQVQGNAGMAALDSSRM